MAPINDAKAARTPAASPGSAEAARSAYGSKGPSGGTGTARSAALAQAPQKPTADQVKVALDNAQATLQRSGLNVLA